MIEEPVRDLASDRSGVELVFRPFEIKTLRFARQ
jgi:hypothetical protein